MSPGSKVPPNQPSGVSGLPGISVGELIFTASDVSIKNSILLSSSSTNQMAGHIVDSGHNIMSGNPGSSGAGQASLYGVDPRLGALILSNSFVSSFSLQPGSPALGAADPADFPTVDQRGVRRGIGKLPDSGAYESRPSIFLIRVAGVKNILTSEYSSAQTIESSLDLKQWTVLDLAVTNAMGVGLFADPRESGNFFYRTKQ